MRLFVILIMTLGVFNIKAETPQESSIIKRYSGCDYFLIYNSYGYIVAEHFGGSEFDEGKTVFGNVNSYGFKDIYDKDLENSERVYIEDYGLSKESAIELLLEKCAD